MGFLTLECSYYVEGRTEAIHPTHTYGRSGRVEKYNPTKQQWSENANKRRKGKRVPLERTTLPQSRDPVTDSRGMRGLSPEQTTLLQSRDPDTDSREMRWLQYSYRPEIQMQTVER